MILNLYHNDKCICEHEYIDHIHGYKCMLCECEDYCCMLRRIPHVIVENGIIYNISLEATRNLVPGLFSFSFDCSMNGVVYNMIIQYDKVLVLYGVKE